jgi:hypothetical protein
MSKLLLSALMLAVVFLPAVQAQGQANYSVDVKIVDLPAQRTTNGTQMSIPFNVTAEVTAAAPCLASPAAGTSYTITLSAVLVNSTGNNTFVNVNPRSHTIAGPVLIPVTGGNGVKKSPATLVVDAGAYEGDMLNATVKITASFAAQNGGCTGITTASDSDEKTFKANFEPVTGYGETVDDGQKLPGAGLGLTLVALAGLVLVLRRK